MSSNLKTYLHKGLIVRQTDKAILIVIPHDMPDGTWFTWLPKSMLKEGDQDYFHYTYRNDFEFKLIQTENIDVPMKRWKNVKKIKAKKFKHLFEEYETEHLDEILLIHNIDFHIDTVKGALSVLKISLSQMQETKNLPSQINDLIDETDLSDLDLLIENLTLAKERYKNEI